MVVLLQWGQGVAAKGDWMVMSITLLLGEHSPQPFLRGICLKQERLVKIRETPDWVRTGPSFSRYLQPPVPLGIDPLGPSLPLSPTRHTRGMLCWQIP